jgi:5-bromo-4-chloroindolyl phosphate hydrolysis protein
MLETQKSERTLRHEKLMITFTIVGIVSSVLAGVIHMITIKRMMK